MKFSVRDIRLTVDREMALCFKLKIELITKINTKNGNIKFQQNDETVVTREEFPLSESLGRF